MYKHTCETICWQVVSVSLVTAVVMMPQGDVDADAEGEEEADDEDDPEEFWRGP